MIEFQKNESGGSMSKVKVKHRPAGTFEEKTEEQLSEERIPLLNAKRKSFNLLPDKIAQDSFYMRNQEIPTMKKAFPFDWKMHFSDLFYPYASDGPLYIDVPQTTHDLEICKKKYDALEPTGINYVYITKEDNENSVLQRLFGGQQ